MMMISNELLDELLKDCRRPEDLLGEAGLMKELKVRLMERMLGAELTAHLGYEAGAEAPTGQRDGVSTKRVKGSDGEVRLSVARGDHGEGDQVPRRRRMAGPQARRPGATPVARGPSGHGHHIRHPRRGIHPRQRWQQSGLAGVAGPDPRGRRDRHGHGGWCL